MIASTPPLQVFAHYLAGGTPPQCLLETVNWEDIFRYYPAECLAALPLPEPIATRVRTLANARHAANTRRLALIRTLTMRAAAEGIPLLYVKGAAEIVAHARSASFLSARIMADIDVLCPPAQIENLHHMLQAAGHDFYDYGLTEVLQGDAAAVIRLCLHKMGHLVYHHGHPTDTLEVHIAPTGVRDLRHYPPEFCDMLWRDAITVDLSGVGIQIPSPEHRLVYSLCHAASPKNTLLFPSFPPRSPGQSLLDYASMVLDRDTVRHLCQLHLSLTRTRPLQQAQVHALLAQAMHPLLAARLRIVAYYLPIAAWISSTDYRSIKTHRRRLLQRQLCWQWLRNLCIECPLRLPPWARLHLNRLALRLCGRFVTARE